MDVVVDSDSNSKAMDLSQPKSIGGAQATVSAGAPSMPPSAVFIKKSASIAPMGGVSGGAVKISGVPPVAGGVAGVKMTGSVAVEMPSGFKSIDRNIYVCRSEIKLRTHELPRCHCKDGQRCVPTECENAKLFVECSPERCPVGDQCQNQRFQKRQYAGIVPKRCGAKGWGIFAQLPISAGQFVIEYVGEVIDADELEVRSKACANDPHYYFLSLTGGETIDASKKGNISRFINHSCDPNCITQKWQVNGESRVGIFALRNIRVGEELTFDYQFERFSHKKQRCLCGAANCSKYLGSKPKPKNGEKAKQVKKKEMEVIRYKEVAEAILPDEHVAVLLEDQDIDVFPFTVTDGKWYFLKEDEIPMETDTEEEDSSSSSSDADNDSDDDDDSDDKSDGNDSGVEQDEEEEEEERSYSESQTEMEQQHHTGGKENGAVAQQDEEPPKKARKLQEGETPHTSSSNGHSSSSPPIAASSASSTSSAASVAATTTNNASPSSGNSKKLSAEKTKKKKQEDSGSDSDAPMPRHRAREFVNKVPRRAPVFRRSQAHQQRLRLLDQYTDMLYEKIDKLKEKKTLMQDAELAAVSSLVGVDATNQSWMASLDIKQLIKDGLLEFEPISPSERAQSRRVSTRSSKR